MKFQNYLWKLYLNGGGQQTVQIFKSFLDGDFKNYPKLVEKLVDGYCPDRSIVQFCYHSALDTVEELQEVLKQDQEGILQVEETTDAEWNREDNLTTICKGLREEWNDFHADNPSFKHDREAYGAFIPYLLQSTQVWAFCVPDLFFPYFYSGLFYVLTSVAELFEIELPPIPGKKQYLERIYYYGKLCIIFSGFAKKYGLSTPELWAFLYDFGPSCAGGTDWVRTDVPPPQNVFVFGHGAYYPEKEKDRKWICQGNPNMQPGDIGLLYHWSPDQCFSSIWRVVSPGYFDPLGIHDRYVCYGHPIEIPPVTYDDLKKDPVFSQTALIKQRMLRMDGTPILPSEYMHLLSIAWKKGAIPDSVPTFEIQSETLPCELILEREVEAQLLEPLLLRLGWKSETWCRQMPVHIGRGTTIFPDYVINPVCTEYNQSGEIVLEAKLTISNKKQLELCQRQVSSYAKLLGARACVLVAREGIWIAKNENSFSDISAYSWKDLLNQDIFSAVFNVIGNQKKNKQKTKKSTRR